MLNAIKDQHYDTFNIAVGFKTTVSFIRFAKGQQKAESNSISAQSLIEMAKSIDLSDMNEDQIMSAVHSLAELENNKLKGHPMAPVMGVERTMT